MFLKATEKGQALVMITLAAIGLIAFAALAIDGSRIYSDKRHAQNAADTAALAAALAYTRDNALNDEGIRTVAQTRATSNGYDDGASNDVTVTAVAVPSGGCPGGTQGKDITVQIVSYVDTSLARVFGRNQATNAVTATSRACGYYQAPLFDGHAIVSLNPNTSAPCGVDTGNSNSKKWFVTGSGVFSNGCLLHTNGELNIPNDKCLTAVGGATVTGGGNHGCVQQNQSVQQIDYPDDVNAIMPPNPCGPGGIGLPPPASGSTFTNGVYCISNLDAYDREDIILNNATLYVTDPAFSLKFSGSGGLYGSATQTGGYTGSGPYENYYMIVARNNTPCQDFSHGDQVIEWRGNGAGSFTGTVLAPSACLDLRGNGNQYAMNSQIIGYSVSTNGTADVYVNYDAGQNHRDPVDPTITIWK